MVANPDGSSTTAPSRPGYRRAGFERADIASRAWRVALRYLVHGTTAIRAHVDTGEDIGLKAVEAILAVRGAGRRGRAPGRRRLQRAGHRRRRGNQPCRVGRRLGCWGQSRGRCAGHRRSTRHGAVDVLCAVATEAGVGVDLHIDETLDPEVTTIDRLIEVAKAGLETANHGQPRRQPRCPDPHAGGGRRRRWPRPVSAWLSCPRRTFFSRAGGRAAMRPVV